MTRCDTHDSLCVSFLVLLGAVLLTLVDVMGWRVHLHARRMTASALDTMRPSKERPPASVGTGKTGSFFTDGDPARLAGQRLGRAGSGLLDTPETDVFLRDRQSSCESAGFRRMNGRANWPVTSRCSLPDAGMPARIGWQEEDLFGSRRHGRRVTGPLLATLQLLVALASVSLAFGCRRGRWLVRLPTGFVPFTLWRHRRAMDAAGLDTGCQSRPPTNCRTEPAFNGLLDRYGNRSRGSVLQATHHPHALTAVSATSVTLRRDRAPDEYRGTGSRTASGIAPATDRQTLLFLTRTDATHGRREPLDVTAWLDLHVVDRGPRPPLRTWQCTLVVPHTPCWAGWSTSCSKMPYSPPGSIVSRRCDDGRICVGHGCGISAPTGPSASRSSVLDAVARGIGGNIGLGLAITKRIVGDLAATVTSEGTRQPTRFITAELGSGASAFSSGDQRSDGLGPVPAQPFQ